jgi:hypothetical protein
VPRKSEFDRDTHRTVVFFASADAHWNTCPAREEFARGRK